ncbi:MULTISPECIES: hypothetical protein [unclassified Luteococcus]|uniref:hypothetical protein n=1 Tax=unclassified Luteococcus TaxID=2639923 RepID=UPI00313D2BA4
MSIGSGERARAELARRLEEAGHQVPSGTPGVHGRGADFEAVVAGLSRAMIALEEPDEQVQRIHFPPLEPRAAYLKTDYLASFPQLTGAVDTFTGNDKDHRALLKVYEEGGEWADRLEPSGLMMVPATCHNVYPRFTGELAEPARVETTSWCFRHEPETDPLRMVCFRMQEEVYLGNPQGALAHRDRWLENFVELLGGLGLEVSTEIANDPFFGRAGRILAVGQQSEALKFEVLVSIYDDKPTAIASGNAHRSHFGENFAITLPDGSPAHSSCAGLGLERTTIALLVRHGMDVAQWPTEVRQRLGLETV